jgi:hypothetical protein
MQERYMPGTENSFFAGMQPVIAILMAKVRKIPQLFHIRHQENESFYAKLVKSRMSSAKGTLLPSLRGRPAARRTHDSGDRVLVSVDNF